MSSGIAVSILLHSVFIPVNPYFGHDIGDKSIYVCIAQNYDFSCFNWWVFKDGQSIIVCTYMPRQGVILEQEVCSTTPIKIKRIFSLGSNSKPPK